VRDLALGFSNFSAIERPTILLGHFGGQLTSKGRLSSMGVGKTLRSSGTGLDGNAQFSITPPYP
ncbi:MAG: hypothetical protein KDA80_23440, partial [Planctomycetaceae bacterium]|nr:hypothetical protein [Planctomycetaceae bacterium]